MIYLLWPTIRPETMISTHKHWLSTAAKPADIKVKIAVNIPEHGDPLHALGDVLVVGDRRRGTAYPAFRLFNSLEADPADIVVCATDDVFPSPQWDEWLVEHFRGHEDAIIINDGGQYGACCGQPTMTYACVQKLKRIVIHPSYHHFYADAELYNNLMELGAVRDLRGSSGVVFEHRNWAWGKREKDAYDDANCSRWGRDEANFNARMRLPLVERLKVDEQTLQALLATESEAPGLPA
jgi:hypothetical protein